MADKKISEFAMATVLTAVDTIPVVQTLTNKQATLGQLRTFITTPLVANSAAGVIAQTANVVKVSGACTLAAGTVEGAQLTIISTAAGSITATGLLPSNGFNFAASGATLVIIWANGVWNVISTSGMTPGIV